MNVLIIDDTQADHDMCVAYLSSEGGPMRFYHAYTSREGLELYRRHAIDCVLLDYHLPDMDGLEVLKALSSGGKAVPVIMMTADGNEMVAVTAMKLGSQDYLPKKALTASALRRAVDRAAERAEMMERMERYRAELERSNRDLEQFATIVAHDLKSPLRAVSQHLTLLKHHDGAVLSDKSCKSLEFAVDGAKRMAQLIDALFDYAHMGFTPPAFSEVSLDTVLDAVLRDLGSALQESGACITRQPLPALRGDPVLLAQLLQNLIANAIKYCNTQPHVDVCAKEDGQGWRISVCDNGIGIPAHQQEKIFGIFRRLHRDEYPGIGMGLAVCERIVKLHGGRIGVQSSPGQGSEFFVWLPGLEEAVKEVAHG